MIKEKSNKRKGKETGGRENGERDFFFFISSFLSKIYGNWTIGFYRSKRQSRSTHRELRVSIKILEFRQIPRGREFSY